MSQIELIITMLDFDKFKVNLLATIHLLIAFHSLLILVFKADRCLSCRIRQVSSAKSLGSREADLQILLISRIKRSGPRTEP